MLEGVAAVEVPGLVAGRDLQQDLRLRDPHASGGGFERDAHGLVAFALRIVEQPDADVFHAGLAVGPFESSLEGFVVEPRSRVAARRGEGRTRRRCRRKAR